MPKRAKGEDDDFIDDDIVDLVDDEGSDYDEKPKKKRAPAKPKAEGAPKKKAAKAEPLPTEPTLDPATGWIIHPPSLLYKIDSNAKGGEKIAAFDLDGTLVDTKSGARFPVDADDWCFYNPTVPSKLKEYHDQGYQIVIFSNQGGVKSALTGAASLKFRTKVNNTLNRVREEVGDIPIHVFAATQKDEYRKPDTGMWKLFVNEHNGGKVPDLNSSFFVGDDVEGDSSSDSGFAYNVGVKFMLPEIVFGKQEREAATSGAACNENQGLVNIFAQLATALKEAGENPYKFGAFRKVSAALAEVPTKITAAKDVKHVKGIGKSSMEKIDEFLKTGTLLILKQLEEQKGKDKEVVPDKNAQEALRFL